MTRARASEREIFKNPERFIPAFFRAATRARVIPSQRIYVKYAAARAERDDSRRSPQPPVPWHEPPTLT